MNISLFQEETGIILHISGNGLKSILVAWPMSLYNLISLSLPVCVCVSFYNTLDGWVAKRKMLKKVGRDEKSLGSTILGIMISLSALLECYRSIHIFSYVLKKLFCGLDTFSQGFYYILFDSIDRVSAF